MKNLTALLAMVLLPLSAYGWRTPASESLPDDQVRVTRWDGEVNDDFLKAVRSDIEASTSPGSKVKVLKVGLMSPGGSVITGLEVVRLMREAEAKGLRIEIRASSLCASMCTFVIAAGSPGYRFTTKQTLVLVHPPQIASLFSASCINYAEKPKDQTERVSDALLDIMVEEYIMLTGKDRATVEDWLTCGNEQAGNGTLLVSLNMADRVEE